MDERIRVLIVDEEDLFRRGLAITLAKDPQIGEAGQARSGDEAARMVQELRPKVVLVALRLPDMSGVQLARTILRDNPETRVAMIARTFGPSDLVDCARAGVQGYLTKDITLPALVDAVKRVSQDETYISPAASRLMIEELAASAARPAAAGVQPPVQRVPDRVKVTEREREVLQLIVQGATNRDIAARLMITENTVKVHLRNILDKLHLRNRQQAAAFAVSSGLVELHGNAPQRGDGGGQKPTATTWRQRSGA
jgi:two-component system NarL family response regulator